MTTADKLESNCGIHGFRQRIQMINDVIAKENQKTETITKEIEIANDRYNETLNTQNILKDKIKEVKDEIVKVSKQDIETRIKAQKDIFSKMQEKLKNAEEKKLNLENRLDEAENKTRDCATKMTALNLELEYNNIDSGRKSEGYKNVSESAAGKEKYCQELEELVNAYDARIDVAQNKIAEFESRMEQTEKDIDIMKDQIREDETKFKELIMAANTDLAYFSI